MRKKIGDLLNVNISELSIAGLLLLSTSLGIGLGATMAVGLGMDAGEQEVYYQRPLKRVALVGWFAAAAIYFGGQWVFNAVGVSVERKKNWLSRRSVADWAITRGVIGFSAFGLASVLAYSMANAVLVARSEDSTLRESAMEARRRARPESIRVVPEDNQLAGRLPFPSVTQESATSPNQPSSPAARPPAGGGGFESTPSQPQLTQNEEEERRRAAQKAAEDAIRLAKERWLAEEARRKAAAFPAGSTGSTGTSSIEGKAVSNPDAKVTAEKTDGNIVPSPMQGSSPADQAFLNSMGKTPSKPSVDAVSSGDTEQVGGTGGWAFRKEGRGPLLGFRYRVTQWDNEPCLAPIEPIFDPNAPLGGQSVVMARNGYAVGALNVDANRFVHAVQIVFMRLKADGRLDSSDSYTSPWLGSPTGKPVKTIGGNGTPVVGIVGRQGAVLDAIGLILRSESP